MTGKFCAFLTLFLLVGNVILGCGEMKNDSARSELSEDYAAGTVGNQGFLTEDGYYYTVESEDNDGILLYYHDLVSEQSVPVCSKAECDHRAVDVSDGEATVCNAQISVPDGFAVYEGKIYYLTPGERTLMLRCRDGDGNNDEKVAEFDAAQMEGSWWIYGNHAFVRASTDVSQSFDPETRKSDERVSRFFSINLENGKTDILGESSLLADINHIFWIYRMEKGRVYYYDFERKKWYVYDTGEENRREQSDPPAETQLQKVGTYISNLGCYAYGFQEDDAECCSILQMDWNSGEERVLYKGEAGDTVGCFAAGPDALVIMELSEKNPEKKKMLLYHADSGEITQVPETFYNQEGMILPDTGNGNGVVYSVLRTLGEEHQAEWEERYSSWEDIFAENGNYQMIQRKAGENWE